MGRGWFKNRSGEVVEAKQTWIHNTEHTISAAPLLIKSDPIYALIATHEGKLVALGTNGEEVWQYNAAESLSVTESFFVDEQRINSIVDTPVIGDVDGDGHVEILFATMGGSVHCIDMQGKAKWQFQTEGVCYASPLLTKEQDQIIVVFGSHDKHLYKVTGTGQLIKKEDVGFQIESRVTRAQETLVVGGHEGEVYACDLSFQQVWRAKTEARVTAEIVATTLTEDKQIVFLVGSQDGKLYVFNAHGETLWTYPTKGAIVSAALVDDVTNDDNKDIIIGSCDNTIYCIDAFGELIWSYETDFWVVSQATSSPLLSGDKQIIVGSYDQKLYILEGQGTYALSFIPGLSGIVNQTGQHAITMSKEAGESKGKKLFDWQTIGQVVGCVKEENHILVTTKEGSVACYELQ